MMVKWNWQKSLIIFLRENEHLVLVLQLVWCIGVLEKKQAGLNAFTWHNSNFFNQFFIFYLQNNLLFLSGA